MRKTDEPADRVGIPAPGVACYGRGTSGGRHPMATARVPMAAPHDWGPAVFVALPVPLAAAHPALPKTNRSWPQEAEPAVLLTLPVPLTAAQPTPRPTAFHPHDPTGKPASTGGPAVLLASPVAL